MHRQKPLITYFLFAYNQEKYIEEACRSAFSQTYSPLQIIISDDCSTDSTYEIISRLVNKYCGPHQILVRRNETNLGLVGHVNKAFEISDGEIIVAAAGDDVSLPVRAEQLEKVFYEDEKALLVHSRAIGMDEQGSRVGEVLPPIHDEILSLEEMSVRVGIYIGATGAWRKDIYRIYGPIVQRYSFEDGVLGFRAALSGGLIFLNQSLVIYRKNVGLSSFINKGGLRSGFQLERKRLAILKGLMSQRRADLETIKERLQSDTSIKISKLIDKEIKLIDMQYSIFFHPSGLVANILRNKVSITKTAFKRSIKSALRIL